MGNEDSKDQFKPPSGNKSYAAPKNLYSVMGKEGRQIAEKLQEETLCSFSLFNYLFNS